MLCRRKMNSESDCSVPPSGTFHVMLQTSPATASGPEEVLSVGNCFGLTVCPDQ
ncbi:Hypothetical predicted protein, partial [Marmota monax]